MSSKPKTKGSRTRKSKKKMDYKESEVSTTKRVQDALREARKSSRERGHHQQKNPPRTPTGLVIATSPKKGPANSRYLDMNSPVSPSASEINHMDQLLAPTYESRDYGSSVGILSPVNTSDDIIKKIEMEIATARKAATEAQSRLAVALNKSWEIQDKYSSVSDTNHDPLDDLNIPLRDILSISSAEPSPNGARPVKVEREVPKMDLSKKEDKSDDHVKNNEDGADALKNIESVSESDEGSNTAKTDQTDATDSPTGSSSNGSHGSNSLRYTGTQQTFESGVELGLEDVEATLATPANIDMEASTDRDEDEHGSATPRNETLPDEYSDYTEETVSGDEDDDDNLEYTEETVHSDEEEGEQVDSVSVPEISNLSRDTSAEEKPAELDEGANSPSPKPWVVGSRNMHKSPKEVKPWWSGGWWPEEEKAEQEEAKQVGGAQRGEIKSGTGTDERPYDSQEKATNISYREELILPACDGEGTERVLTMSSYAESRARSVDTDEDGPSEAAGSPVPENEGEGPEDEVNVDDTKDENKNTERAKQERTADATNGGAPVLRDLAVNTGNADPREVPEAMKDERKDSSSRVQFRQPYPVPPQVPRPRPAPDIIADNTTGTPKRVTRWSKPKPEINGLLAAVKGDSLHRRSNAVGALKILLSREAKNQVVLVRTTGFLEALVFACSEDIQASPEMETAIIARGRAVTTIMKVSELKENRVLVLTEPGLPEALVKVIKEDTGEARAHACAALAMLAKTPMNREYMVKVDDLVNALALVVNGSIDPKMGHAFNPEEHKQAEGVGAPSFSFEDEATDASSTASSTRQQSSAAANLYHSDSIRKQKDEKKSEFELQARVNACATLMHLSKHCSISSTLSSNLTFMESIMTVSRDFDSPLNTKCIEIVCNITRFHANTSEMARDDVLLATLLKCGKSKSVDDRVWALRSLQNIAADSSSKVILANGKILTLLSICAMRKGEEQVAAVATLYNLSTEPSAVVPLTNTRNVVATLVHLAHNPNVPSKVQRMSCEALATIGLWLQTLAGSGTVPEGVAKSLLPTHKTVGWQRWA